MSTFLEICQTVNNTSGVHGNMTDVNSSKHLQSKIASAVNTAWLDIQLLRKDWTFMIKRHQTFTCTAGQEIYEASSSLVPEVGIEDLGTYKRDSIFLDHEPLRYVGISDYPYIDNSKETKPTWFTIDPSSNDLYLQLPDDFYTFDIYYRRSVQNLFEGSTPNSNVPEISESYHSIIAYKALTLFAVFLGNPELYGKADLEYNNFLGVLMREFLPSKRMNTRSII